MATFRYELDSKPNKNGVHSIYLCVSVNGKRKRKKTPFTVNNPSEFNAKCKGDKWIRSSVLESKVLNNQMRDLLQSTREKYIKRHKETDVVTSEDVVNDLCKKEKTESFLAFAIKRTQELHDEGSLRNWKKYNGFCNKLKVYLKLKHKRDLFVHEVTPVFLSDFYSYLRKLPNSNNPTKVIHINTVAVVFNIFRTLVKRAITLDIIKPEKDPFLRFKYSTVKTNKEKLNEEEMERLINLNVENGSMKWHTKNCFLFSYYCAGIRVGDLVQLRWRNVQNGRLNYQMGKNHKVKDLVLIDQAQEILNFYYSEDKSLNDYVFPFMDIRKPYAKAVTQAEKDTLTVEMKEKLMHDVDTSVAELNKYLKKIAAEINLDKPLSMHISRHSFAHIAKGRGADNFDLQQIMAHSSLKTTENYMGNFDTSKGDQTLINIFSKKSGQVGKDEILEMIHSLRPKEQFELFEILKSDWE